MADKSIHKKVADLERLIAEYEKIEESLRQSETYYRTILENAYDGVTIVDQEGIVRYQSPSNERILGHAIKETVGKPVFDLLAPDDLENAKTVFARLMDTPGVPIVSANRFLHKDGSIRVLESRAINLLDDPHVQGIVANFRDVTEQKKTEEALLESEERYRSLFESSPVSVVVHSSGKIVFVNPETVRTMGGQSPTDFIGKSIMDFVHPDFHEVDEERVRRLYAKEGPVPPQEQKFVRLDGTIIDILMISSPVNYQGTPASQVVFQNITERKRAETALKRSEERLRLALDAARMGTWEWNVQTGEIHVSVTTESIYGVEPKSTGRTVEEYSAYLHPEDRGVVIELIGRVLRGGGENSPSHTEYRIVRPDGETRWVETCGEIARDADGVPQRVLGTIVDITERKQTESEKRFLESQLRHAQKMETIGTLTGGIAHDFNNILAPIVGYTELVLEDLPKESPGRKDLESVLRAARRAKDLIKRILLFSRQDELQFKPVDIAEVVEDGLRLSGVSLPAAVEIRREIDASLGTIEADPIQIQQVLMNLCANAYHAMSESGGVLTVRLTRVEVDEELAARHPNLMPGPYARLTVSDTGQGMDRKTIERIFEPFFTTKRVQEGTGLGLAVVHGIVKNHRGEITVESASGRGTTFRVYLPCSQDEGAGRQEEDDSSVDGHERLLFVDDEEPIVTLGRRVLERLGYKVDTCTSGRDALEVFRADPDRYDLVISDQTMPKMTGVELVAELRAIRPDLPVILTSGLSEELARETAASVGVNDYIMKPFISADISRAIRRVLDPKTSGE
jgi:PAS domain S-box-containing protein